MTDEKIKEEFEIWMYTDSEIGNEAIFASKYDTDSFTDDIADYAQGFYAGFRIAERLAKIEVLEELSKTLDSMGYDGMYNYGTVIDRMLSGLKAKGH